MSKELGPRLPSFQELKRELVANWERKYILELLDDHHGSVRAAAREAQMDRANFLRLMRRHGIRRPLPVQPVSN